MKTPNHTQVPHEIVDKYLPELKGSEIKVLLVIARQTIGWHKQTDRISISQMQKKTGMSKRAVIDASRSLEAKGIIRTEIKNGIKSYEIAYEERSQEGSAKSAQVGSVESAQADNLPVQKVHRGSAKSAQAGSVKSAHTKETITKETITKERVRGEPHDALIKNDIPSASDENTWSDAIEVSEYLLESICLYDPTHKYNKNRPALKVWAKDIDLAMRRDGRTKEQLEFIIRYIFRHAGKHSAFWATNILSGASLRKQFDRIKLQIKQESQNHGQRNKSFEQRNRESQEFLRRYYSGTI